MIIRVSTNLIVCIKQYTNYFYGRRLPYNAILNYTTVSTRLVLFSFLGVCQNSLEKELTSWAGSVSRARWRGWISFLVSARNKEEINWYNMDNFNQTSDYPVTQFSWPDYVVFGGMLLGSAVIGIYYAFCGPKQNNTSEFLMAGRNMGTFPVAMSLIASFMSAITLLGTPAEIYQFGTMYWLIVLSYFLVMPATNYLYLPIFYRLQVTSAYEYLELRFHKVVRCLGSATFSVQMCLYMAVVVYAPALALSQVTGIHVYISCTAIFLVCIFYTVVGGMKAVIWTDTLQVVIMYISMIVVVLKGHFDEGGSIAVWSANAATDRVEFGVFDPNPTTRHSVWNLIIGGYFTWVTIYGVNQSQVQRYLTVPTIKQARNAIWINLVGLVALISLCCYGGMVIFARFKDCDPLTAKYIQKPDQLFPLFVMDTLGSAPGVPGLFVAGIFSGALSTVSSGLNSLAAILLEDFVRPFCCHGMSDARATNVSKFIAILFGALCFGLVFVASQLGNVLEAALSIFGIIGGPLLGVFTLGMFFPWANAIGAGVGLCTSLLFMLWIGIGAQVAKAQGFFKVPTKPLTTAGCNYTTTFTTTTMAVDFTTSFWNHTAAPPGAETEEPLGLYELSYMWYSACGCLTVIIVGLIVSVLTGIQDPKKLNPDLICNTGENLYWFLPKRAKEFLRFRVGDDYELENKLQQGALQGNPNEAYDAVPDDLLSTNCGNQPTVCNSYQPNKMRHTSASL